MKLTLSQRRTALTRTDVIAITFVGFMLVALVLPHTMKRKSAAQRISCLNNLKETGNAYCIWAEDHGDRNPAEQTVAQGGWADLLTNADQGAICWTNYLIMANEFEGCLRPVTCTQDERHPPANFKTDFKNNSHVSYFVGVSANDTFPQSIQGGDRNLGYGPAAYRGYGYSPETGKGNDVAIQTNSLFKPVSWSSKMHSGAGNILLADGSGQTTSSAHFRQDWLSHAEPTTNWPAGRVPATPSIRLVFP